MLGQNPLVRHTKPLRKGGVYATLSILSVSNLCA